MGADRDSDHGKLKEGAIVKGVVKNITDYGAFVTWAVSTVCCTSPTWHGVA